MTNFDDNYHANESVVRKLHPMTMFYQIIMNIPAIAFPLYFAFFQGSFENWFYIALTILVLTLTIPMRILNYYYFDFSIQPKDILINSGVFSRKHRSIPVKRIQNINIEQNFLQRLLGIAKVTFETAGNSELEGQLEFVSKKDAFELKDTIQNYKYKLEDGYSSPTEDLTPEIEPVDDTESNDKINFHDKSKLLYEITFREIIIHGMTRFRPVLLVLAIWTFSMAQQFYFIPQIEDIEAESMISQSVEYISQHTFFSVIFIVIFLLLGTWLLDVILTFNQFYNFKLYDSDGKLLTDYGLLTKKHTTIPLNKMQSLTILSNPIKKKFDYFSLIIQTAGYGAQKGGAADIAIPIAQKMLLYDITKQIGKIDIPNEFTKVSRKTIRRSLIRGLIMVLPIIIGLIYWETQFFWLLALLPLIVIHSILRWKFMGFAISEDNLIIKTGYFRQKSTIIPIQKIQTISLKSSFFQRRLGLSSLITDTASHSSLGYLNNIAIPDILNDDAELIMHQLIEKFTQIIRK